MRICARVGLPAKIEACLFDMDGVLTRTALAHRRAWKATFDAFLREWTGGRFAPFTAEEYREHVDGRRRHDGVAAFLRARGIELPAGTPGDGPERRTVHGLANAKNRALLAILEREGVQAYPGSVAYVRAARCEGLSCAVVTASANAGAVLRAAGLDGPFAVRVDGAVARREGLAGKPAPDMFLAAAAKLGIDASRAAVFEDAPAGVAAARAGAFGYVVGVERDGDPAALAARGADVVVDDLAALLPRDGGAAAATATGRRRRA